MGATTLCRTDISRIEVENWLYSSVIKAHKTLIKPYLTSPHLLQPHIALLHIAAP
jgi:hypothetical protein